MIGQMQYLRRSNIVSYYTKTRKLFPACLQSCGS